MIFSAERATELFHENMITDRSIWDVCAFTLSSKTITWNEKKKLVETTMLLKNEYDAIFYIDPQGIEIEDNGVREIDSEYRDKIDEAIKALLEEFPPKNVYILKGSTEERINQIKTYLKLN